MKMIAILAICLASAIAADDDGKLTIEIPAAVQATIAREKGDAGKVTDFQRVNETDGTTFVIRFLLEGKPYRLALDAAGRVMRKELDTEEGGPKPTRLDAVPPKVRATLQREAGAGLIHEIEEHRESTRYITEVIIGRRKYRIIVDAAGVLLGKEYMGDGEEQ